MVEPQGRAAERPAATGPPRPPASDKGLYVSFALRRLPQGLRWHWHRLGHHGEWIASEGLLAYLRWSGMRALLRARDLVAAHHYRRLTPSEVAGRRRSHRVFIFGSGYSLNDLSQAEWDHLAAHDVFGFAGFVHQRWVRVDFQLIRSWTVGLRGMSWQRQAVRAYARHLWDNPLFADTVFLLQRQYSAEMSNMLVGERFLPPGAVLCRYRTARRLDGMPTLRWRDGLQREPGTLASAVNAAFLLGWTEIVLVGVDLYDNRYFWGPADGTLDFDAAGVFGAVRPVNDRGLGWNEPHNTVRGGMVDVLARWRELFAAHGVHLMVYNPRSLLARALPVYPGPARGVSEAERGDGEERILPRHRLDP